MKQSKVLFVSIFLTAVVFVVVGSVTAVALAKGSTASQSQSDAQANAQVYQQREAQYNQLIQQANQQLDKANAELQALQNKVNQLEQASPSQSTSQPAITPDQADQIARQAAGIGQGPLKPPDLVSYQGKAAYEVLFTKGTIYVDAQSGEVLYNGTVPQKINADQAAQIVIAYLHNPNVLSVDQVTLHNTPLYRVIFKNGTLAWVDMTGQITDIQLPMLTQNSIQASFGSGQGNIHLDEGISDN